MTLVVKDPFGTGPNQTTANVGVANIDGGITAVEYGNGSFHKTVITIDSVLPIIAGGANLAVGKLLYTLPSGAVIVNSSKLSVAITQTNAKITANTPDVGIGTTIASGAVAVLGGTSTFENILTGQTASNCNGTATVKTVATTLVSELADNKTVYLNVADGWSTDGDAGALITGTVTLVWEYLG